MITCIIIEDEPKAQNLISEYVLQTSFLKLQAKFDNPLEAINFLKNNSIDVVFTDGTELKGVKSLQISFPSRAAPSEKGSQLFLLPCQSCQGRNGEGQLGSDSITSVHPPLSPDSKLK